MKKLKMVIKKLNKFFINYWVSPKYGNTQFYLQPDISEHTHLNPSR